MSIFIRHMQIEAIELDNKITSLKNFFDTETYKAMDNYPSIFNGKTMSPYAGLFAYTSPST